MVASCQMTRRHGVMLCFLQNISRLSHRAGIQTSCCQQQHAAGVPRKENADLAEAASGNVGPVLLKDLLEHGGQLPNDSTAWEELGLARGLQASRQHPPAGLTGDDRQFIRLIRRRAVPQPHRHLPQRHFP